MGKPLTPWKEGSFGTHWNGKWGVQFSSQFVAPFVPSPTCRDGGGRDLTGPPVKGGEMMQTYIISGKKNDLIGHGVVTIDFLLSSGSFLRHFPSLQKSNSMDKQSSANIPNPGGLLNDYFSF